MTRNSRTGSASLERVESGLALGLQLGGFGGVLAEDEGTGDEADEEGDEVGDHGVIRKGFRL